jgi:hypothetical protein
MSSESRYVPALRYYSNPFNISLVVPFRQMDDRQAQEKLIGELLEIFVKNAPKRMKFNRYYFMNLKRSGTGHGGHVS